MEIEEQGEVPLNLRKRIALAVRNLQWSYAIFWSISSANNGRLEWYDGYYNGEIKTRKTVQSTESNTDQLGLQRTDQLRELYESLSLGETNLQAKRPTAALIPEDLSNAEWYFLVCMSFKFGIEQGLPGKAIAKNEVVWLRNAHRADTKFFSRSLLAKSAGIQTIACFPHFGGVIELGTNDSVQEDLNLIEHVKIMFLDNAGSSLVCKSNNEYSDNILDCEVLGDHFLEDENSPNVCSDDLVDNLFPETSNLVDGIEGQSMNFQFLEDAISNCLNNSMNSSDTVSQTYEDPNPIVMQTSITIGNRDYYKNNLYGLKETDIHYKSVLSSLLKSSHQLILGPYFGNSNRESSFVSWIRDGFIETQVKSSVKPQNLVKKVLIEVPKLHANKSSEGDKQSCNVIRQEVEETDKNHVLSERKRREKINERFVILGSIIPSGGKVDKVSILDHTIEYLRELEKKLEGLESYKEKMELERPLDAIERTSDNYGNTEICTKLSNCKKNVCDSDKSGNKSKKQKVRDSSVDDVTVQVVDKEVLIDSRCIWTENTIIAVMGAVSKLRLDIQTFDSSNVNGILSMTIKAKCKGLKSPSASVIRQAIQKVFSQEIKARKDH